MSKLNLIAEPGSHKIEMSHTSNAPRELVFKVYTDPKLVPQFWGQRETETIVEKMDVKYGGTWRYVMRNPDGAEYAFKGVYHQVVPNEKIVYTFEFEGMPGHICLETVTFEEHDGKTTITDSLVFQSVEDRDGMLDSGMEEGANEFWDQFEELLGRLQTA